MQWAKQIEKIAKFKFLVSPAVHIICSWICYWSCGLKFKIVIHRWLSIWQGLWMRLIIKVTVSLAVLKKVQSTQVWFLQLVWILCEDMESEILFQEFWLAVTNSQGPVVQSVISLTSSLRVILLTVLADSIYNILTFFSKKFQHICVSLNVNFNESLTNDVVSFEQLGPGHIAPW